MRPAFERDRHLPGTWPARWPLSSSILWARRDPGSGPLAQTSDVLDNITLRPLQSASDTDMAALRSAVFSDYAPSELLADVMAAESASRRDRPTQPLPDWFGIAAFRDEVLVGWTQGYREGANQFCMLNSGVAVTERRKGVYSRLVQAVLAHAQAKGYAAVRSRHAANNNGVIIAKLRLGFQVSGFEYSEVYGPLVHLTFLVHEERRRLYTERSAPIRPAAR